MGNAVIWMDVVLSRLSLPPHGSWYLSTSIESGVQHCVGCFEVADLTYIRQTTKIRPF